jgi:hypothetical protein
MPRSWPRSSSAEYPSTHRTNTGRHHEGDGAHRHQNHDDLRVPWKKSHPGAGRTIEYHRDSEKRVCSFPSLYAVFSEERFPRSVATIHFPLQKKPWDQNGTKTPTSSKKGNLARGQIPFKYCDGAEGGTRTTTGFSTQPSRYGFLHGVCSPFGLRKNFPCADEGV